MCVGVGVRRAAGLQKVVVVKDVIFLYKRNTKQVPHFLTKVFNV